MVASEAHGRVLEVRCLLCLYPVGFCLGKHSSLKCEVCALGRQVGPRFGFRLKYLGSERGVQGLGCSCMGVCPHPLRLSRTAFGLGTGATQWGWEADGM